MAQKLALIGMTSAPPLNLSPAQLTSQHNVGLPTLYGLHLAVRAGGETRRGTGASEATTNKRREGSFKQGSLNHTCIHAASSLSFTLEVSVCLSLSLSRCTLGETPVNRGKPLHGCQPPLHPQLFWCRVPLIHSTLGETSNRQPFFG